MYCEVHMKRHLLIALFLLSLFATWACRPILPVPPSSVPTPTPTIVPGCGVSILLAPNSLQFSILSSPVTVATPAMTPIGAPVTSVGWPGVIRNFSDWQTAYGSVAPPVDFNQKMLLPMTFYDGCGGGNWVESVCWDDTQITVEAASWIPRPGGPVCNATLLPSACLIVVPQTNLPIVSIGQAEYW